MSPAATIKIRTPQPADFEAIARLTNIFIETTTIHFGADPLPAIYHQEAYEKGCKRYPWLVAFVDGAFAGFAKSSVWRERDAYRNSVEVSVYIEEAFRRAGVARALYLQLFDELRQRDFHIAIAGATLPNDASVRFHESVGFKPVGTFHEVGRKFDQWHDVAFFELRL